MDEGNTNLPDRRDRRDRSQGKTGFGGAEAAFCDELLCCYTCGKVYFSRRPIRLRTPGRLVFHVCFECSNSLNCAGCGEPVASRSAIIVEEFLGHTGGSFCPMCRDKMFLGLSRRDDDEPSRARAAFASVRDAVRGLLLKIAGVRLRLRRKPK